MIAFSRARFAANRSASFWRFWFFWTELVLAIFRVPRRSVHERHLEALEESLGFLVGLRRGADHDVHATHGVDLVVIDFGEHELFLEAQRVVAVAIEALAVDAAEIADARQG